MSSTSIQFQVAGAGEPFTEVKVPYPEPQHGEIRVRTKAASLNPSDWKGRLFGVLVQSWPVVLGLDFSGVVDGVCPNVQDFKPRDEVLCLGAYDRIGNRAGAFQEVVTIPAHFATKKPASLTFEEAASLPICFLTSVAAISDGLGINIPHISTATTANHDAPKSILVLGGSSCTGAGAMQLLRLALPSTIILTTSSAKHHARLALLGATECFERSAQADTSSIKASTPGGHGVDAILDAVCAAHDQPSIFTAFKSTGPKLYSQVVTGDSVQVPPGVNAVEAYGSQIVDHGDSAPMRGLSTLIEQGRFQVPSKVEVVGEKIDGLEAGLAKLKEGVSGTKLVVKM